MPQIVWITPAGSLGVIPESKIYRNNLIASDSGMGPVTYRVIAGTLPAGVQFSSSGQLSGTPYAVSQNTVSRFTVRASDGTKIADRTFSLTVTGNNVPTWVTPAGGLGSYYEGNYFSYQFEWSDNDPEDIVITRLVSGQLPSGLTLTPEGLLAGYLQPVPNLDAIPGYSNTGFGLQPYDFRFQSVDRNFEFTLEITDGKDSSLRTFAVFVYSKKILRADTTVIDADVTTVTADETPQSPPFIVNNVPSDLGVFRTDNYYAYQFIGENYSGNPMRYAISVNEGYGLPPDLTLDPITGWYYGYISNQGATNTTYSFNIIPYQVGYLGNPITCTHTSAGTNQIICNSTAQINTGQPLVFTGTSFGGITASETQVYYVDRVINATRFTVTLVPGSGNAVELTTASGSMDARLVLAGTPTPYTLTLTGTLNDEVAWLTDSDLGSIINGSTSTLKIAAVNAGGRNLRYRLKSGAYNSLPQGLELLPSGEISGRVSFDTFSLDLGATTIDESVQVTRNVSSLGTTIDMTFTFTVNAWSYENTENIYKVRSITVVDGGTGFNSLAPPVLAFNDPTGATGVLARAGTVTIDGGSITAVQVANPGNGYTDSNPAELYVTQGYGGWGAVFHPVMELTGTRDVVSVDKTFTLRLVRKYNKPYQNLLVQAMPPQNDRDLISSLLTNEEIFVPDWIYRPTDPFFGVAKNVTYAHAFGLLPETIDTYIDSLNLNHYRKNLTLGQIKTARAVDSTGTVLYEIVYSQIVDNLVNNDGVSVGKVVNLPYLIPDPTDPESMISQVYPNSLQDMRDQVVDVVGLISNDVPLPLWMTSTQSDGSVLGFTPAWIIAYTNPGRAKEIAYYISSKFNGNLNQVDFSVDRYILDTTLSHNWNYTGEYISGHNPPPGPEGNLTVGPGIWNPNPPTITTFDIYAQTSYNFIGSVNYATDLSFTDINGRTLAEINQRGGIDGVLTTQIDGDTLIFVTQQGWNPPPGNNPVWNIDIAYPSTCVVTYGINYYLALQDVPAGIEITDRSYWLETDGADEGWMVQSPFDPLVRTSPSYYPIQSRTPNNIPSFWVNILGYNPDGLNYNEEAYQYTLTDVYNGSPDPLDGQPGSYDSIPFSDTTIVPGGDNINCYSTSSLTNLITCDFTNKLGIGEQIVFTQNIFGGIEGITAAADLHVGQSYHITDLGTTDWTVVTGLPNESFWVGKEITVVAAGTGTGTGRPIYYITEIHQPNKFAVSRTFGGETLSLTTGSGDMIAVAADQRMGIWTINVDPVTTIVTLTFLRQTNPDEYVRILGGSYYTGAQLYYPTTPGTGLTRISWLPVVVSLAQQTTFDQNSMQFIDPVDMYSRFDTVTGTLLPVGDSYDKYLIFPKVNILV